jgi:hypothetical protein
VECINEERTTHAAATGGEGDTYHCTHDAARLLHHVGDVAGPVYEHAKDVHDDLLNPQQC